MSHIGSFHISFCLINKADEATGMPSFSHGITDVMSTGKTAAGMSMLMGAAAQNIKAVVRKFKRCSRCSSCSCTNMESSCWWWCFDSNLSTGTFNNHLFSSTSSSIPGEKSPRGNGFLIIRGMMNWCLQRRHGNNLEKQRKRRTRYGWKWSLMMRRSRWVLRGLSPMTNRHSACANLT